MIKFSDLNTWEHLRLLQALEEKGLEGVFEAMQAILAERAKK